MENLCACVCVCVCVSAHVRVCVCVCVCVCLLFKPPWKAPLLKSHVGLQTLQSCRLIVYSAISGSRGCFGSVWERKKAESVSVRGLFSRWEVRGKLDVGVFMVLFFALLSETCNIQPRFKRERQREREGLHYLFCDVFTDISVLSSTVLMIVHFDIVSGFVLLVQDICIILTYCYLNKTTHPTTLCLSVLILQVSLTQELQDPDITIMIIVISSSSSSSIVKRVVLDSSIILYGLNLAMFHALR